MRDTDILESREFGQQIVKLKHKTNFLVPESCQLLFIHRRDFVPVDNHIAIFRMAKRANNL
jgi:hypothetical protein